MADGREQAAAPARAGFPVGLTVAVAAALAILIGLGVWQLQRLKWKEGLLAHIAALQHAQARPIEPVLDALARGRDVDFTRVRLSCPGLGAAPFLELYGLKEGGAGWRLVSACQVASLSYRTILVDRGFVADTVAARPPVDRAAAAPVELVGVLRTPDRPSLVTPKNPAGAGGRWFTRDVPAMAHALGAAQPAPIFLFAETSSNPELAALQPAPLPAEISNRHLEYALTWFGLAAALAGVYLAVLFRRRKN
ncbi:MAG TPA: SURF1 family cytochrome oxidase biogenesis protein [Phenylobacterium sp.]|uniref:SURF1 family protein n=1 Tax=Phenylobacterium sp. TaxID=1871053 RepID=UPI002B4795BB|nr:SURF1 family cytochrome oxidase biogenesis protein [Phenylobacterium sp.]HKR87742.1 SURF1 family cytochrome oxidase biogenesis protein [Phenylobacterium sp.]